MTDDDSSLAEPHPAFSAYFTDPLYEDPSEDLAPFGSDEGWDLLAEWAERRSDLGPRSTVADVLEDDPFTWLGGGVDELVFVQAAGFVLLRLTGQIDDEGRRAVLAALALLGSSPVLDRQRLDLEQWASA